MGRKNLALPGRIERRIYLVRGCKVMLSTDLAELYDVEPRTLVQAVKRNIERFPDDFMFQLTWEEVRILRSQFVILRSKASPQAEWADPGLGHGKHAKHPAYAFTEQGVAMLSGVLRSRRAVLVNVEIMRAFVRLREILAAHRDLARRLEELEKKYDARFKVVFEAIRRLMAPQEKSRRPVGFRAEATGKNGSPRALLAGKRGRACSFSGRPGGEGAGSRSRD